MSGGVLLAIQKGRGLGFRDLLFSGPGAARSLQS
jgi:hypothetical protein